MMLNVVGKHRLTSNECRRHNFPNMSSKGASYLICCQFSFLLSELRLVNENTSP